MSAPPKSPLGIAATCYMTYRRFRAAEDLLEHAAALGAAGIQAGLPADARAFRERADKLGLYYEAMLGLGAINAASLEKAKEAGARCLRSGCLSGRRYETFSTMAEWRAFVAKSKQDLTAAVKAAEAARFPIGLENHKDWTADEMVALLKEYSSEYLGACVDTGNNVSLLDDPYELVEKLAPFAVTTHIKDMGVAGHDRGFLLAEVGLGGGYLDMPRIFQTLRRARPEVKFVLEMITRDPLVVPCLTEKYWATFSDRRPEHLARTLRAVKEKGQRLEREAEVPAARRVEWEEENVRRCLHWARERLSPGARV